MSDVPRRGDWIQVRSGIRFYPLDPRPEEVVTEDVVFALAFINRFNGHVGCYSVAEHSVRVARLVRDCLEGRHDYESVPIEPQPLSDIVLAALLHDAAEAYCVDLPRPIKHILRASGSSYDEMEHGIQRAVERRFRLATGLCGAPLIKYADNVLLATERRDLFPRACEWSQLPDPLPLTIEPWDAGYAAAVFLRMLYELEQQVRVTQTFQG